MQTITATSNKAYPLRALLPSPSNVRRKPRTPADIMAMAVSINALGLLQNLVVVPELKAGRPTGRATVAAGETRRLALLLLANGKVPGATGISLDFAVPVKEISEEEAVATSVTENVQRQAMHPADQFEAFRTLYEQCGSVEQVAAVFSVSPTVVERRLRLAAASPRLFALYRDDAMTLDQLMALCVTEDHAAQERVWDAGKAQAWNRDPDALRAALTRGDASSDSPLVRFVGLKAYEAAGGHVRRDLFADADHGWATDVELLHRLATEKFARAAAEVQKEGWSWVEVRGFGDAGVKPGRHECASKALRVLTDDERGQLQVLQTTADNAEAELDAHYERLGDDAPSDESHAEGSRLREALGEAGRALSRFRDGLLEWTPEVKACSGVVLTAERNGKVAIHRGLIRPEDRRAAARAQARTNVQAQVRPTAAGVDAGRGADPGEAVGDGDAQRPLSESLVRRLTAHRTVALQCLVAGNPQVALAALAHNLVQRVLDNEARYRTTSALDLSAQRCTGQLDAATDSTVQTTRAWQELQEQQQAWRDQIPSADDNLLGWLIRLPLNELCELLALCVALTVNAVQSRDEAHRADPLAAALGLDMADWWEPTAAEYLSCVPKALVAAALEDAGAKDEAVVIAKLKKGEAVARAEAVLRGRRWLPAVLRFRQT